MLKKEEIKDGNWVFNADDDRYHIIQDVGNAIERGDRSKSNTPDDELSYDIVDIITNDIYNGICENSHMTSKALSIANEIDIDIYLANLEADADIELGMAKKQHAVIQDAINRFNKLKYNYENNKV